jgi:hypothetical protein
MSNCFYCNPDNKEIIDDIIYDYTDGGGFDKIINTNDCSSIKDEKFQKLINDYKTSKNDLDVYMQKWFEHPLIKMDICPCGLSKDRYHSENKFAKW